MVNYSVEELKNICKNDLFMKLQELKLALKIIHKLKGKITPELYGDITLQIEKLIAEIEDDDFWD